MPKIAPRPCSSSTASTASPTREPANRAFYAAAREPKEIWEVPDGRHIGGVDAQPQEYERRVVGFFDRALLQADEVVRCR